MKNKSTKIISGLLAALMLLTGCQGSGKKEGKDSSGALNVQLSQYGQQITVEDIKSQYTSYSDGIMPLYNVARDEAFEIDFNFSYDEAFDKGAKDFVTVHTDSKCLEESMIYTYSKVQGDFAENMKLEISPVSPTLATGSEKTDYIYNDHPTWGNAPIFYIAIWYDTENSEITKLETPVVIPFTVKNEIEAPNVKGVVDNTGRFKLVWDPIEGAEEYRIYKLLSGQSTGISNHPVKGAEYAYSDSLIYDETTTELEFDNFAGAEHGLALHERSTTGEIYVIGQNFSVCGDFYVSAVVNGKESGLGAGVSTSDLKLPYIPTDESDIMFNHYSSVDDLPLTLDVINIDGSITPRNVIYTFGKGLTWTGTEYPGYKFEIEGTAISGCVSMDDWDIEYPETVGNTTQSANVEPENNINKVPDNNVDTIITDENKDSDDTLVQQQKDNTKKHVEDGKNKSVVNPENGVIIFADSAEEEWIALNFINGETEISLEAFPQMQDPNQLEDVIYKVYYQNPYILGLYRFEYDYSTFTLKVEYLYDKDTIAKKQGDISEEAGKIISEIIKDEMTDEEKRLAIYTYLEANCKYDDLALENAQKNNFVKDQDSTFEDSFNSYGIIVNKNGVCQSYAYAYKLLCAMVDLDCKVMTGYLNGNLPHAWNVVEIDGQWYQVDSTNNSSTTGIPFFLYNADTDTASDIGFTCDKLFELDSLVSQYTVDNDSYEYYYVNKLTANSLDEYSNVLDKCLTDTSDTICIRYNADKPNTEEIVNCVREVYNKHGLEQKLPTLSLGMANGYILLNNQ